MLWIGNCRKVKSDDFSESELDSVIRGLKNGKSMDTLGFISEIFKQSFFKQIPPRLCLENDELHQEA